MKFRRQVATIYRKELIDILRDHRTLIAMIVVPIVLYPLLMLGSVQAVTYQAGTLKAGTITIGVVGDSQRVILSTLIQFDAAALAEREPSDPDDASQDDAPRHLMDEQIRVFDSREDMEAAIHRREIPVGVLFLDAEGELTTAQPADIAHGRAPVGVEVLADPGEPRGMVASDRLWDLFLRLNERQREARDYADPFRVESVDMSSPASILGTVLPLILVLMTITGAIYPAIDLTAGERERGTLESLMVCPVGVMELIVGKFLVVTTVAVMGAALNLASVTATVYFGGFGELVAQEGEALPIGTMVFILLALIPFAVFMSAIMMAVCSYARTFKEAQNYVTPVILAVLIPGGLAAFPATRLEGPMLVMPVGNMVALAKELMLGSDVPFWRTAIVLLSTCLYAGAAIAAAAAIFGRESVVFADAGTFRGSLRWARRRWTDRPSTTMGLILVALLFPGWFFVQSALSPAPDEDARFLLYVSGWLMPVLFVVLPLAVMWYWRVRPLAGFSLRIPRPRYLIAAVLIGLSTWAPAHEFNVLQQRFVGMPMPVMESARQIAETITAMSPWLVILVLAVVPAICEELLFRGFLLNALAGNGRKWAAILGSSAVFAVFHFFLFKLPVTFALGVLLAYLCWQSRSIVPAMIAHLLHNSLGVLPALRPEWFPWLEVAESADAAHGVHLPTGVLVLTVGAILVGVALILRRDRGSPPGPPAAALS